MMKTKSAWLAGWFLPALLSAGVYAGEPTQEEVDAAIAEAEAAIGPRSLAEDKDEALGDFADDIEKARQKSAGGDLSGALSEAEKVLEEVEERQSEHP